MSSTALLLHARRQDEDGLDVAHLIGGGVCSRSAATNAS